MVDKLSAGDNQPRFDTLKKIKNAFPQTNMNWLISGLGEVVVDVKDDNEVKLLEQYRLKIKTEGNQRLVERFSVSVDYFVQDHMEMEELENNAKAQDVKDKDLMLFRMELLLFQYRRQLVSYLLLVDLILPLCLGIVKNWEEMITQNQNQKLSINRIRIINKEKGFI